MIKAVNMKNYRFGKLGNYRYEGFGMLDTETNTFVSYNGSDPYVLRTKKIIQSCIDAKWFETMNRCTHFGSNTN